VIPRLEVAVTVFVPPDAEKLREVGLTVSVLVPAACVTVIVAGDAASGQVAVILPVLELVVLFACHLTVSVLPLLVADSQPVLDTENDQSKVDVTVTVPLPALAEGENELGLTLIVGRASANGMKYWSMSTNTSISPRIRLQSLKSLSFMECCVSFLFGLFFLKKPFAFPTI
jgi:hypothetical protein